MGDGILTHRREVVAAGLTALIGSVSGCSSGFSWTNDQGEDRRVRLCQHLTLTNYDSEPHVFHVLIERDGEIMKWWSSDEIPPDRGVSVELGDWHWQRGRYTIYASYDEYTDRTIEDLSYDLEENIACILPLVEIYHRDEKRDMNIVPVAKGKNEYSTPETTEAS